MTPRFGNDAFCGLAGDVEKVCRQPHSLRQFRWSSLQHAAFRFYASAREQQRSSPPIILRNISLANMLAEGDTCGQVAGARLCRHHLSQLHWGTNRLPQSQINRTP